ncbi:hypothetical protein ACVWW6_006016 [Bradyrhizobium sp. USDA 3311]
MDVLSIAAGAAGVGVAYFLYLCATKGLPVAWAWLKAKWNAGKAGLAVIEQDVAGVTTRVGSLENSFALLQGEFDNVKALLRPAPAATPAPAVPAAPVQAAAPQPAAVAQPGASA